MQLKSAETLAKMLDEECPEVLDILVGPQGDWHLADAKELGIQLNKALQEAYRLGRMHEKFRCANVLTENAMHDASDIIRDLPLNDDIQD